MAVFLPPVRPHHGVIPFAGCLQQQGHNKRRPDMGRGADRRKAKGSRKLRQVEELAPS